MDATPLDVYARSRTVRLTTLSCFVAVLLCRITPARAQPVDASAPAMSSEAVFFDAGPGKFVAPNYPPPSAPIEVFRSAESSHASPPDLGCAVVPGNRAASAWGRALLACLLLSCAAAARRVARRAQAV